MVVTKKEGEKKKKRKKERGNVNISVTPKESQLPPLHKLLVTDIIMFFPLCLGNKKLNLIRYDNCKIKSTSVSSIILIFP